MRRAAIAASLLLMSLASWNLFPGHTWLQQDTQIYVPILEHLRDSKVLAKDLLVEHPHVAYTVYDELALSLRKGTGLGFEEVLGGLQILFRALGLLGVYCIATSLGLAAIPALVVTMIWSLGATIHGPAVLTVEYEAVPRGFAVPLLMLAIGLAARAHWALSGFATGLAVMIHPPTVWPVLAVYLWKFRLRALAPVALGTLALIIAARLQPGGAESQRFLSTLSPSLEALQRLRAPYNWVDTWWLDSLPYYILLTGILWFAARRLADRVNEELRHFVVALPLLALCSVPMTFLTLNVFHWALIPQLQPMRALLFITALASVFASAAGFLLAERKRYAEAFLWFVTPWLLPVLTKPLTLPTAPQALVCLASAALCVLIGTATKWGLVRHLCLVVPVTFCYWAMTMTVILYPRMHSSELSDLSRWAASATNRDTVFLFADNGKANRPGIFRTEALRAVYADWKGGGQVNYLPAFAAEWQSRWKSMQQPDGPHYAALGVDYVVMNAGHILPAAGKVYENTQYWVYKTR